jgi:hypothetical protein
LSGDFFILFKASSELIVMKVQQFLGFSLDKGSLDSSHSLVAGQFIYKSFAPLKAEKVTISIRKSNIYILRYG